MCALAMATRTDEVTLGNLDENSLPRRVPHHRDATDLLTPNVIKLHNERRELALTIGARFGLEYEHLLGELCPSLCLGSWASAVCPKFVAVGAHQVAFCYLCKNSRGTVLVHPGNDGPLLPSNVIEIHTVRRMCQPAVLARAVL
jgi:hypothetical protein